MMRHVNVMVSLWVYSKDNMNLMPISHRDNDTVSVHHELVSQQEHLKNVR